MAKKNTDDFHSKAHGDTYKPEWAEEFDTDESATQRSDSERLDRAIERGVEAAEALERDETLGLVAPRQRSRRRPVAMLAVLIIAGAGVGIALSSQYGQSASSSSSQQEVEEDKQKSEEDQQESQQEKEEPPIAPTKQDDGTYRAHVVLEASKYDVEKYVIVPRAVESAKEPWAIRVHATIDTSSQWMSSCLIRNGLHGELITHTDWCDELDRDSRASIVEWSDAADDHESKDYSWMRQSDVEQIHILPTIKTRYDPKNQAATLKVSGESVSMDIDFIPVSALAVPWDRSEPLRGDNSTFIAFSGSLKDLTLNYGSGDLELYAYGRVACGSYDNDGWASLKKERNAYKVLTDIKTECIDKLGFNDEDASGYLFVEARSNAYSSYPLWWVLK